MPALMLVLLILVQFALWAYAAQTAQLAASEGDRVARSEGGGTAAGIERADAMVVDPHSGLLDAHVDAHSYPDDVVEISVSARAISIVPGLSLPVSSAQVGPIQEFRESG